MSKGKIIAIGVLVSLIVPVIRVLSILKDNWEMEDQSKAWLSNEVSHNVGHVHIAYWSASYTGLNFLKDILVGMVIYTIVIFLSKVVIRKMNLNRSR